MNSIEPVPTQLGTRKVIKGTRSLVLNIPKVAVRSLRLKPGEELEVSLAAGGAIIFQRPSGE